MSKDKNSFLSEATQFYLTPEQQVELKEAYLATSIEQKREWANMRKKLEAVLAPPKLERYKFGSKAEALKNMEFDTNIEE